MTRRRKVHRREPYAWLEKLVGRTAVFLVASRTDRSVSYRVTVTPLAYAGGEEVVTCSCPAGQFHTTPGCFHAKRALASFRARTDPNAKKGRAPVAA